MTQTYNTRDGEVLISTIKGKQHFLLMHDADKTYKKLIDKTSVKSMVDGGFWKLKAVTE